MTFSGGEPMLHPAYLAQMLRMCREAGLHTAVDTAGCVPFSSFETVLPWTNLFLYDIKLWDEAGHRAATGVSNQLILENLSRLADDPEINGKIWMRMPLIQGLNDTPDIIARTCAFYREHHLTYVTLFPYHELGISKYKSLGQAYENFAPPDTERLHEIQALFQANGTKADILGEQVQ